MPANYVLLEKITVGAAGASSVTFSGIPQTGYTDLLLVSSVRTSRAAYHESLTMSFNGLTTNRTNRRIYGDGSGAASTSDTVMYGGQAAGATATASTFGNSATYIPNYAGSANKSSSNDAVSENNAASALAMLNANLWSSSAAITQITLTPENSGTIQQYSTFYLYGVAALGTTPVIVPYATGGDTIMTDGTYWYHAFKASGTFTPAKGLSCDVLVVAGGGSGGSSDIGGGGGAGGLIYSATNSLTATNYTVTVGAGAAANANGTNSQFTGLTAAVGGGKGAGADTDGFAGGSGGGAGKSYSTSRSGGAATSGQGNSGGGNSGGDGPTGGGGGAGSPGGAGSGSSNGVSGNGGAGVNTYSSWLSATGTGVSGYVAGGGGGGARSGGTNGTGGAGGGGAGSKVDGVAGVAGIANTGGGGGGSGIGYGYFSTGGSGIVIVRYAV